MKVYSTASQVVVALWEQELDARDDAEMARYCARERASR